MKQHFPLKNIALAVGFWLGLPLLILIGIAGLLLGQIAVVGIADRLGLSPVLSFNILTVFLLGLTGVALFLFKSRSERRGFFNWSSFNFPAFGFRSWRLPTFGGQSSATANAPAVPANGRGADAVCKILFIHHQAAAVNQTGDKENSDFDCQIPLKAYAKTNNS